MINAGNATTGCLVVTASELRTESRAGTRLTGPSVCVYMCVVVVFFVFLSHVNGSEQLV